MLTAGVIVLADITTAQRRGQVMAIYQGTFLFAVGIGPFPGGWLAERFGLPAPFIAYGITASVVGLIAWLAVDNGSKTRAYLRSRSLRSMISPLWTHDAPRCDRFALDAAGFV